VNALKRTVSRLLSRSADPPRRGTEAPVPPEDLIRRAGWTPGTDVIARYLNDGRAMKETVASLAETRGRVRALDFGCGVGKVSRHFAHDTERFELYGVDIDGPSVDWLAANHSFYGTFARVEESPGLPWPDRHFDLIYAVSVFTHMTDPWSGWLLELRRVLAPSGLLVVTVLGEGMIEVERGGAWNEDEIGMNVLRRGQDWAGGGPTVFHSHWWIREHWGRAFEIVEIRLDRDTHGAVVRGAHDLVIMRPLAVARTAEELERIGPAEPRELRALQRNIAQLHADDAHLRGLLAEARARGDAEYDQRVELARQLEELRAELERLRRERP
jgi:SAM-dependent methyltransferase